MKCIFFDKTGTLTINEMKLDSVYLSVPQKGQTEDLEIIDSDVYMDEVKAKQRSAKQDTVDMLLRHFAANHSLSFIKAELLGDPMEIELFEFCGGMMEDEDEESSLSLDGPFLG